MLQIAIPSLSQVLSATAPSCAHCNITPSQPLPDYYL